MNNKPHSHWDIVLPLVLVLVGLVLLVIDSRPQQILRNSLFDQYQRLAPRVYSEVPVLIVDIDDESLARLGQWPWPRTRMATLLDKLGEASVATVAFDILFAEADRTSPAAVVKQWNLSGRQRREFLSLPDHDQVFAQSLQKGDTVLGFATESRSDVWQESAEVRLPDQKVRFIHAGGAQDQWLPSFRGAITALPVLELAAKGNGALSFVPDSDGVVRRVPMVLQVGGVTLPTLVSESLRVAQGAKNMVLRSAGEGGGLAEVRIGEWVIPTTAQGEIWVHYAPTSPLRYVSAWKVLAGDVDVERLKGHIVLVGSSAQGLMDLRFNPFGMMPGVEAHAQALEQILSAHFLQRPGWARGAETLILIVAGLAVGMLALRRSALSAAGGCLLILVVLSGFSWQAYANHGVLFDSATPALGLILIFVLCSLWHHFSSEREQRWIRQAFARYVSPNRVAHLVDHPEDMKLGGIRQECSFVFTDLAGFTSLMESIDPGEAVALLNAYLDEMIAIAFRHEGTLDRIVGDSVAIMFSAPVLQPDHRARALACALDMDDFAQRYAQRLQGKGVAFGKTRIGVHGGEVIVGNFGGLNIFDYRALGDPVNTASRLENVNKHLGTRVCLSSFILEGNPDVVVRPVGRLLLKGKTQALEVFELMTEDEPVRAPLDAYGRAFEALRTKAPEAAAHFRKLAETYPDDPLVTLHQRRLQAGEQGDLIVLGEK